MCFFSMLKIVPKLNGQTWGFFTMVVLISSIFHLFLFHCLLNLFNFFFFAAEYWFSSSNPVGFGFLDLLLLEDLNDASRGFLVNDTLLVEAEIMAMSKVKYSSQVTAKDQIRALTKKLEEAEKAKEQAKQDGYDVGVAETEEALRAEVSEVCRYYCLQVWNEALNQAGVEASSILRRAESVYYPTAIRALGSSGSKANTASKEADAGKESSTKVLPSVNSPSNEADRPEVTEKDANMTKEVA